MARVAGVVLGVEVDALEDLVEIVPASRAVGGCDALSDQGDGDGHEDHDHADHNQQFDQRESRPPSVAVKTSHHNHASAVLPATRG